MSKDQSTRPDESEKERIDRELGELLQELRVAIPGVQILFAFLLTIPFSQGFAKLTGPQKSIFLASLLCAAAAAALLISPTAYHRLHFRANEKERLLFTSNHFAVVGLGLLALAIALVVYVVTAVVFEAALALPVAIVIGALFGWLWYGLPLMRKTDK